MSDSTRSDYPATPPQVVTSDLPDRLQASHLRFINTEHLIGTVMSGLVPALVILLFRHPVAMPVFGTGSLASALIPSTLLPGVGMPIGITYVTRYRVRSGGAPGLNWPFRSPGLSRFLPRQAILRGVVTGLVAIVILPPISLGLISIFGIKTITGLGFNLFQLFYGMALGALLLRPIVTRALSDGSRRGRTVRVWSKAWTGPARR